MEEESYDLADLSVSKLRTTVDNFDASDGSPAAEPNQNCAETSPLSSHTSPYAVRQPPSKAIEAVQERLLHIHTGLCSFYKRLTEASSTGTIFTLFALVIAIVTAGPTILSYNDGHRSEQLAEWTAWKEFIEFCESHGWIGAECEKAKDAELHAPPVLGATVFGSAVGGFIETGYQPEVSIWGEIPSIRVIIAAFFCGFVLNNIRSKRYPHGRGRASLYPLLGFQIGLISLVFPPIWLLVSLLYGCYRLCNLPARLKRSRGDYTLVNLVLRPRHYLVLRVAFGFFLLAIMFGFTRIITLDGRTGIFTKIIFTLVCMEALLIGTLSLYNIYGRTYQRTSLNTPNLESYELPRRRVLSSRTHEKLVLEQWLAE